MPNLIERLRHCELLDSHKKTQAYHLGEWNNEKEINRNTMLTNQFERLRIIENDRTSGLITAKPCGFRGEIRVITGFLDCNPGEVWNFELEPEQVGDDPAGLLWLVDAQFDRTTRKLKIVQDAPIQLDLFAA